MSKKTHYETLGVKCTEDEGGIKAAFRQLAKQHHPDLSGPQETRRFQDILEAYSVLSDPVLRASYNESLRRQGEAMERGSTPKRRAPSSYSAAEAARRSTFIGPRVKSSRAWIDSIFDRFVEDAVESALGAPRRTQIRTLAVDVVLSAEEADRGGTLPLWHPALGRCRFCGGVGLTDHLVCLSCRRRGVADPNDSVLLRIPRGIADGSVIEVPVGEADFGAVLLRVYIRVRGR